VKRLGLATFALVGVLVALACGGSDSYIYPARQFDRARGCVNRIASLGVVDGTNPGSLCSVVCLVSTRTDGGPPDLWISSECEPYPAFFDISGTDPDCARAIAIYMNGPPCAVLDGGPLVAPDAGPEEGGAVDSGSPDAADPDSAAPDAGAADAAHD